MISTTDPNGVARSFAYSPNGQLTSITTAAGTSTIGYSGADVVSIADPLGNVITRVVDSGGRLAGGSDALGNQTTLVVDAADEVVMSRDPLNAVTSMNYDSNGNRISLTDANGNAHAWQYDAMDRVIQHSDPLGRSETFSYNLTGHLNTHTDRKQQQTVLAYDALDRLSSETFADGSSKTFTHDAGNRLTQVTDSISGTIARTFDGLDHLTSEVTAQGTVSYTYDAAGRRLSMQVSGRPAVLYSYDAGGRITAVQQGPSTVAYAYDPANRRTGMTLPNGISAAYAYDAASRLTSLTYTAATGTVVGDLSYAYDPNGRRISAGGTLAHTKLPDQVTSAVYDSANQLVSWGGSTLTYDANGSVVADGQRTYTWSARGLLAAVSGSASISYDGLNRRIANSAATSFLYDGVNAVREVHSDATVSDVVSGPGMDDVAFRGDPGGVVSYLTDALGSTAALTGSDGAIQTEYTYEPFGATSASGVASLQTLQFTGRESEGNGLYYYRARYYSPVVARFISEDPIGFDGGINLYEYAGDAPSVSIDPLGYASWDKWYGYNNRDFQDWFHRHYKVPGDPDASQEEMEAAYEEWQNQRRPARDRKGERRNRRKDPDDQPDPLEPDTDPYQYQGLPIALGAAGALAEELWPLIPVLAF